MSYLDIAKYKNYQEIQDAELEGKIKVAKAKTDRTKRQKEYRKARKMKIIRWIDFITSTILIGSFIFLMVFTTVVGAMYLMGVLP